MLVIIVFCQTKGMLRFGIVSCAARLSEPALGQRHDDSFDWSDPTVLCLVTVCMIGQKYTGHRNDSSDWTKLCIFTGYSLYDWTEIH